MARKTEFQNHTSNSHKCMPMNFVQSISKCSEGVLLTKISLKYQQLLLTAVFRSQPHKNFMLLCEVRGFVRPISAQIIDEKELFFSLYIRHFGLFCFVASLLCSQTFSSHHCRLIKYKTRRTGPKFGAKFARI